MKTERWFKYTVGVWPDGAICWTVKIIAGYVVLFTQPADNKYLKQYSN